MKGFLNLIINNLGKVEGQVMSRSQFLKGGRIYDKTTFNLVQLQKYLFYF